MAQRLSIKQLEELYAREKEISELKISMLEEERNRLSNVLDQKRRIAIENEIANERQQLANAMMDAYNKALEDGYEITGMTNKAFQERLKQQQQIINSQQKIIKNKETILSLQNKIKNSTHMIWNFLMESDKVIKSTTLNLGMSAAKAEELRLSFEGSAGLVARLGGNLGDIQSIMEGYANETGRARALSSQMVEDVFLIGKGTGLGIEQGTKLAAQFELMGLNARAAMDYAQGVVETSELMGVNTTKVLKNITDNFEKLQKMTFSNGVKGFAAMAQYAEKFKIDMSQSLDAAETARSLENAVDMAAQLQVLGGQFAATDPFQMLFQARNAPDEFQKTINEMTRGVATFRKTADNTFENFISPADIDRLKQAATSLGLQEDELIKQARRMNEIQTMRQQMVGMGLTNKEKELIEGMATFSSQTGKFNVQIAGTSKDIRDITSQELKILQRQSKSLEERAEAAQTFDEVFRATIEELKTVLLPILQGVNKVLVTVRPYVKQFTEWVGRLADAQNGWLKVAGVLMGAGALWKIVTASLGGVANTLTTAITGKFGGGMARQGGGKATGGGRGFKGAGALKAGLGVGVAAAGIGGGIAIAAEGLSSFADSLSKLTPEQAKTLESISKTLAITFPAAAIGIGLVSAIAAPAAGPLLALGGALLMMGAAVGVASAGLGLLAKGVGTMSEGFGNLLNNARGMGPELYNIAGGIGSISLALATMSAGAFGLPVFAATLSLIGKRSNDIEKVGNAFNNINSTIKNSGDDLDRVKNAIMAISNADLSNLNQFKQLNNILSKPLRVEFSDKEVAMVSNITMNIDGYKLIERTNATAQIVENQRRMREGKKASGNVI